MGYSVKALLRLSEIFSGNVGKVGPVGLAGRAGKIGYAVVKNAAVGVKTGASLMDRFNIASGFLKTAKISY